METLPLLGVVLVAILVLLVLANRNQPRAPKIPRQWEDQPKPPSPFETTPQAPQPTAMEPPPGNRVRISHPMVRRAAERAVEAQDEIAQFFAFEGDELYFMLDAIPDPDERRRAYHALAQMENEGDGDLPELLWLIRRISGR